ncbi:DUF732 domain-containing protein [Mycobacterium sp.]|uniref:DUF732 domain-containing protein n=1 Tax=Mycobacterium sp. TaxID=1785 RepID=UPI003BAEC01A
MFSGIVRQLPVAVAAVVILVSAAFLPVRTAAANPDQDQTFFDLLGQKEIPPVDNANSLIETAHKACSKLDGGMSVGDLVDLIRNNGYNENPLTRLNPADRITRTINQFIVASVEAYCPYDRGKIASIAAYHWRGSRGVVVVLTSVTEGLPTGEIPPTKPLPVPAAPPPPEAPAPAPQQPPPPPRHVQQAPQRQQQVEPPPQEPPPQEPPPQAEQPQAPAAPAPAPEPGGGNGAPAPESPSQAPPAPPGHIRLAP